MDPTSAVRLEEGFLRTSLADEWNDLNLRTSGGSYFQAPEWVVSWWSTVGRRAPTNIYTWRSRSGALTAAVSLAEVAERLHPRLPVSGRVLANAGSGPGGADHCAWPILPEAAVDVRAFLDQVSRGRSLLVRSVSDEVPCDWLPERAVLVDESVCPRIELGDPKHDLGTKLKSQLRQYRRRLSAEGVEFRYLGPQEMDRSVLRTIFDLHERRREMKHQQTAFGGDRVALHEALLERARPGTGPVAVIAAKDGQAIGALYGFWWDRTFTYFQSGWDPEWGRFSLGTVLVGEAMDTARAMGARTFDLLRGPEPYKYRFGARDRSDRTWLVPTGVWGGLLRSKYGWKRGIQSRAAR